MLKPVVFVAGLVMPVVCVNGSRLMTAEVFDSVVAVVELDVTVIVVLFLIVLGDGGIVIEAVASVVVVALVIALVIIIVCGSCVLSIDTTCIRDRRYFVPSRKIERMSVADNLNGKYLRLLPLPSALSSNYTFVTS